MCWKTIFNQGTQYLMFENDKSRALQISVVHYKCSNWCPLVHVVFNFPEFTLNTNSHSISCGFPEHNKT